MFIKVLLFILQLLTGNHKNYLTTYDMCNLAQVCLFPYENKYQDFPRVIVFFFLVV